MYSCGRKAGLAADSISALVEHRTPLVQPATLSLCVPTSLFVVSTYNTSDFS
jgi:hypothetical protein